MVRQSKELDKKEVKKVDCMFEIVEGKLNKFLYVCQKEMATVSSDEFEYIGSDDSTTCCMVVIYNRSHKLASLGHFDGVQSLCCKTFLL